jgi:hypothetical protein
MGKLEISEYVDSSHGNLIEPPVAHQTLELVGEAPVTSAPLNKLTRIVRLVSDDDCLISIAVGASKPTQFLRAGVTENRVVMPDQNFLVSAVAAEPNRLSAGSGLWSYGDLSHALGLLAEPAKAKERLDGIAQAMAEAQALIDRARKEVATSAAAVKSDQERMQKEAAEHAAKLAEAKRNHDEDCERRSVALTARETRQEEAEQKLAADRAEVQALHEDLSSRAEAFERATRPLSARRKSV